ncbi:MAG: glycosyltransferase [Nitrospirota bacterium]
MIRHIVRYQIERPVSSDGIDPTRLLFTPTPKTISQNNPSVTVAVCTKDRAEDLSVCLPSLASLSYPELDVLIIDNAPSTPATEQLVREHYPQFRYICEPRPGLDWARNRAIAESPSEIIAFTDDDVVVDAHWVSALSARFAEDPDVMAVTGLVVPYELEFDSQVLFELYGGFGKGFDRKWYRLDRAMPRGHERYHIGAGTFGTGANMAFRRRLFDRIGRFDPALDVGTVTNGGGDLEMFFRTLEEGFTLVYEPRAIVRHRHRRTYAQLRTQITNNGIGLYSFFVRSAIAYPARSLAIATFSLWWLWWWGTRRLLRSFLRPGLLPRELIRVELVGSLRGLIRYFQARRIASQMTKLDVPGCSATDQASLGANGRSQQPEIQTIDSISDTDCFHDLIHSIGIRMVDLAKAQIPLTDVTSYRQIHTYVSIGPNLIGNVSFNNHGGRIPVSRLLDAVADQLTMAILDPSRRSSERTLWVQAQSSLSRELPPHEDLSIRVQPDTLISIIVATCNRPEQLRGCLQSLVQQATTRRLEIIVVDNRPGSYSLAGLAAEFPDVVFLEEPRRGVSFARNTGIVRSKGHVIVTVDDDVVVPTDWLDKLVAPFTRHDVMAVTGNVLPFELENRAHILFEEYGGLGRGFKRLEYNGTWFESFHRSAVTTWKLGGTANSAYRASIFSDPFIGLLDETLGPGTPTGVGEDTYIFYKILKAGHTIVYEPSALVYHHHRATVSELARQLYNYSKGHVAYHLTTLFNDQDLRALIHLTLHLPRAHLGRAKRRLLGKTRYPLFLLLVEIAGNIAGPFSLWRSLRLTHRLGRTSYAPSVASNSSGMEGARSTAAETSYLKPVKPKSMQDGF